MPPRGLGGPFWADAPRRPGTYHVRTGRRLAGDELGWPPSRKIRSHRLDPDHLSPEVWLPRPRRSRGDVRAMHIVMADGRRDRRLAALLRADPRTTLEQSPRGPRTGAVAAGPAQRQPAPSRTRDRRRDLRDPPTVPAGPPRTCGARPVELVSGEPGPVTSLGGLVGPHRRLALVRASLSEVEAVAQARGRRSTTCSWR